MIPYFSGKCRHVATRTILLSIIKLLLSWIAQAVVMPQSEIPEPDVDQCCGQASSGIGLISSCSFILIERLTIFSLIRSTDEGRVSPSLPRTEVLMIEVLACYLIIVLISYKCHQRLASMYCASLILQPQLLLSCHPTSARYRVPRYGRVQQSPL